MTTMPVELEQSVPQPPVVVAVDPVQAARARAAAIVLAPIEDEGGGTVGLQEILRISFESLLANKLRSLLTMLGVIIGVGAVVALMAIGDGASAAIQGQVQSIGTNVLTVSPGGAGGRNRQPGSAPPTQNLTTDDAEAIAALRLPISGIAPQFNANAQISARKKDTNASVVGTTKDYATLNALTLQSGAFLDDSQKGSSVIVLGATVAQSLFGTGAAVGEFVRINGQALRVIGVLTAKGGGQFGSIDDRAFVPLQLAQQGLFPARTADGNGYRVSSIQLAAQNSTDMTTIQTRIEVLLRQRHHLKSDGTTDDFSVINQAAFLSTLTSITGTLTAFLASIAGISLLVGGIGIMNIMLVSVTERTREIGLRKAVGARAQDILVQFIAEALTLSLIGGALGLMLGAAIAGVATLTGAVTAVISTGAVLLSVGFALAVGLFFGIYPAQRAARLNPIDALRHE